MFLAWPKEGVFSLLFQRGCFQLAGLKGVFLAWWPKGDVFSLLVKRGCLQLAGLKGVFLAC